MNIRFRLDVAFDDETQEYHSNLYSLSDDKGVPMKATSLRKVLAKSNKLMREKNGEIRHFPIQEPSRIISPNGNGAPNLIVPARN